PFEPSTGRARISSQWKCPSSATMGLLLIIYLGLNRYDRAILLVTAWALILVWLFGAWLTVNGRLDKDIIQPALGGGL
ncbi:hypothetical protein ACC724_40005, partial [Rhizobium ruizarguesonis]